MTPFPSRALPAAPMIAPAVTTRAQLESLLENIARLRGERDELRRALETELEAVRQRYRAPLARDRPLPRSRNKLGRNVGAGKFRRVGCRALSDVRERDDRLSRRAAADRAREPALDLDADRNGGWAGSSGADVICGRRYRKCRSTRRRSWRISANCRWLNCGMRGFAWSRASGFTSRRGRIRSRTQRRRWRMSGRRRRECDKKSRTAKKFRHPERRRVRRVSNRRIPSRRSRRTCVASTRTRDIPKCFFAKIRRELLRLEKIESGSVIAGKRQQVLRLALGST